jgi:ABC-type branched-subunit amino acid transport system substrate-binding protein
VKGIVFLIIASLLVIGLVLSGCLPSGETLKPVLYVFEDGKINIGIATDLNCTAGEMQRTGATLAQDTINRNGGVHIGGVSYILQLVLIETGEETVDPTGLTGASAVTTAINSDNVSFILGGLRTEAVEVYRDVAMQKGVIFIDCGAASETLQHSVVDDYAGYRFWFKGTPYNEYFSSQSVVRILGAVAIKLRHEMGVAGNYTLKAAIIADNLAWARDQVNIIERLLPNVGVNLTGSFWVSSTGNSAEMISTLTTIEGLDPEFIIPLFSADAGVLYDELRAFYVPNAMSVGMNVMAQLKSPWIADLHHAPGGNATLPACANEVVLDTWAEGLNQTSKTAAFLDAFMAYSGGEYPLDTAATYDALFGLKTAIEAVAWYEAVNGTAYARADDIIKWLEAPANAQVTTTGSTTYYPRPGTTAAGKPALTNAQVRSLYDIDSYNYTYDAKDWTMPPDTTHDLVYGPGYWTGIGAQWQWDAMAGQWQKVGVWPCVLPGANLTDQYGNWNFAYDGTKALIIPQNVIDYHKP